MISTLFIGFQYAYGNPKEAIGLDSDIFVNSMSKIDDVDAYFFPIDNLIDVEFEIKNHLVKNKYDIIFFNLIKTEFPNSLLSFLKRKLCNSKLVWRRPMEILRLFIKICTIFYFYNNYG